MKLKIAAILAGVSLLTTSLVFAQPTDKQPVRVNNQTCPVSGQPVNGKDTYTYEGKEYNLCSPRCKQSCAENPKKYLSK